MTASVDPDSEFDVPTTDWASSIVGRFIDLVDQVRSVTTQPVISLSRALVFGLVMVCSALAATVVAGIGIFRLLNIAIPGESWSAHLALGALFCALGTLLWLRRRP
ncbi:MAG: hypothetical protein P8M16_04395 [Acidimicrobiales bacterium]|jgi:predicted small integral membrane protein|nr:hypothetical protein [Acidimicrobiales bacterium]